MTTTPPDPQDATSGVPAPPPVPEYGAPQAATPPPPAPGYAVPPPPAPGYGAPQGAYPPPQYGGPQGYPQPAYGVAPPLSDSDQRLWSVLSHIGGVFVSFLVPLVIWLIFRSRGSFVENQSKEALNFQITVIIAYIVGGVLSVVGIGLLILLAAWVCSVIFSIMAAVASSRGELYRYPLTIRMVN